MILNTDYAVVASETFSTIVCITLLIAILFEKYKINKNYLFISCLISIIFSASFDICNYIFQGNASMNTLLIITNLGTNIFGDLLLATSSAYCWSLIKERNKSSLLIIYAIIFIAALDIIYQIVGCLTGLTFTVQNGLLYMTDYYNISYIVMFLCTIICDIYLIRMRKKLSLRSRITVIVYNVMLIIPTVIMFYNPDLYLLISAVAVAFVVIYIGIEKEKEEQLMINMIYKDSLSGLNNRNAYNETISKYKKSNKEVVICYVDLNGLKYTNDTKGHEAGDALIKDFSSKLLKEFNEDVYRIGGDEFVVIKDYDEKNAEQIINVIINDISQNGTAASFGFSHKNGKEIDEAIKEADEIMQKNKTNYYITNKIERRQTIRRQTDKIDK